jgi:hypothetical protein
LWEEQWTSENKTQTQVVGGKEDLLHNWASTLDLSKMALAPQLKSAEFLCLRMQKQASGKNKSKHAVSFRLRGYNLSHYLKVIAYHTNTSVKPGPTGRGSLPSDFSLGFFIKTMMSAVRHHNLTLMRRKEPDKGTGTKLK